MPDNEQMFAEIYKRLGEIDLRLVSIAKDQSRTTDMIDHHEQILCGNHGHPGMKLRMDRMEQLELSRKWALRTMVAAVVSAIVAVISATLALLFGGRLIP